MNDNTHTSAESGRWNYELASPLKSPREIGELYPPPLEAQPVAERFAFDAENDQPTLRRGSRGDAVRRLQQALGRAGRPLAVDGAFGPGTETAVRAFQAAAGLAPDGVVGSATWARLNTAAATTAPAAGSAAPSGVTAAPQASDQDVPAGPLGTLVLTAPSQSFSYSFTAEDLIWTAKLVVHEAGGREDAESAAVLWAMFNHYAFFRHRQYSTFTKFIRAYSTTLQPVLLNWRAAARHYQNPASNFVRANGHYADAPHIPKGQLQRHLDIQRAPWSSIKASARRLATRALRGELPNPGIGNANEFASTRVLYYHRHNKTYPTLAQWVEYTQRYARNKNLRWIGEVPNLDQTKNAFFVTQRIAHLPAGAVRIDPPPTAARERFDGESLSEPVELMHEARLEEWESDPEWELEGCLGEDEIREDEQADLLSEELDDTESEALHSEAALESGEPSHGGERESFHENRAF